MSLFENDQYQWRETYFVMFQAAGRPTAGAVRDFLGSLGDRFQLSQLNEDDDSFVESMTLISPFDSSAMDILLVRDEPTDEILEDIKNQPLNEEDKQKLSIAESCELRFDVYHFEFVNSGEDDMLDPGGLLIVLEGLADICGGVCVDPQAGAFM